MSISKAVRGRAFFDLRLGIWNWLGRAELYNQYRLYVSQADGRLVRVWRTLWRRWRDGTLSI